MPPVNDPKDLERFAIDCVKALYNEISKEGWNLPHRIFGIETMNISTEDLPGTMVGFADLTDGGIEEHPLDFLRKMAEEVVETMKNGTFSASPNMNAFCLYTEGWALPRGGLDLEKALEGYESISDHPDRQETRTIMYSDVMGNWATGTWFRNEEELVLDGKLSAQMLEGDERFAAGNDLKERKDLGRLPEMLSIFTKVFAIAQMMQAKQAESE